MASLGNSDALWFYPRFMGFNPSQRWGHSSCFSNGFLYVFGGCCGGLHFSDVLVLNLDTMGWTNLATTGVGPGPRDSHSAVIVDHMMIIFGGTNGFNKVNDVHILDLWTREWTRPNCQGVAPTPRESHATTMVGDRLVIFGGSGEGDANYLNDLHILDLKTMTWSSPELEGDVPVPRDSHSAVSVDNKIFVYGGDCGDRYLVDVDVFNLESLTWSKLTVNGHSPGVRAGHAAVTIGTKVYIIGGVGDKHYYSDVWMLDTVTCLWTQLDVRGRKPKGRFSHTAIVADSDIAIYGGCGEDERPLNELLILKLRSDHENDRFNKCVPMTFGSQCNQEKQHRLHEHPTQTKQTLPLNPDSMHTKRRRVYTSQGYELIESEPEEHSLSLSQHSSPSHSDQERTHPKHHNKISSTQLDPVMVFSRNPQDPRFNQEQFDHQKHNQNRHAARPAHRNYEPLRVQNLIGAEVHGKVDGAFDSGYLMTATVNGQIFRGVLFPPGPKVVPRGAFHGHNRRSPTSHVAQRDLHINRAFLRHSNHAPSHTPQLSHHVYPQDHHVRKLSPLVKSVPALSLRIEQQKVRNELQGLVLTLGGSRSGLGGL